MPQTVAAVAFLLNLGVLMQHRVFGIHPHYCWILLALVLRLLQKKNYDLQQKLDHQEFVAVEEWSYLREGFVRC